MEYPSPRGLIVRLTQYVIGLFLLALGARLSVSSDLGVSPLNSIPFVLSQISGLTLGTCVVLVCALFILVQIALLGRKFPFIQLTQIFFSFLFGCFVNLAGLVVGDLALPTYPGRLTILVISVVLIALGVTLYVDTGLIPMPLEGLPLVLSQRFGITFSQMKNITDCATVVVASLLSLLFLHRLAGIREGTVITALLTGRLMGPIRKFLQSKRKNNF